MLPAESSLPSRRLASTAWACLYLSLALVVAFPAFAAYGFWQSGLAGVSAAVVAGLVCWVGATTALAMAGLFQAPDKAVVGLLLGMGFRMGLPLLAGLFFFTQGGPLVAAGLMGILVAYYLVALVVETLLSLRFVPTGRTPKKAPKAA